MPWYYSDGTRQIGPVSDAGWNTLLSDGTIKPDTLVWREGMAAWAAHSTVSAAAPVAVMAGAASSADTVRCAECGGFFPPDEVVTIEGQPVCAGCKPLALQKLKEGVGITGEMRYAGFWIRAGAKIIDGILLQIVIRALGLVFALALRSPNGAPSTVANVIVLIISLVVGASYAIWFNGKYGATPGKMACKLRIVQPDGSPISYGRAAGRYFAEMLSSLTLGIGFIMAGFDDEKRALHDRVADTRVIRV